MPLNIFKIKIKSIKITQLKKYNPSKTKRNQKYDRLKNKMIKLHFCKTKYH